MNINLVKGALLFIAGGAVGTGVTGFLFKKKIDDLDESFDDRLVEEIESVKETAYEEGYAAGLAEGKKEDYEPVEENDNEDPEMDEEFLSDLSSSIVNNAVKARNKPDPKSIAKDIAEKNNYVNYSRQNRNVPEKNEVPDEDIVPLEAENEDIEMIAPDEFGEIPSYDRENLYFLRDEVLVDDEGRPVENVHNMIGDDALEEFGVYEPDAVFVRNNRLHTDYAIFMRDETLSNFSL